MPHDEGRLIKEVIGGREFVTKMPERESDGLTTEWDGEINEGPQLEGSRTAAERKGQSEWGRERPGSDVKTVELEPEPMLTADQ